MFYGEPCPWPVNIYIFNFNGVGVKKVWIDEKKKPYTISGNLRHSIKAMCYVLGNNIDI